MVFSSINFIFIFLPIFFICYYFMPKKIKDIVLLLGSLTFYFIGTVGHPEHFIIFILSILMDYAVGLLMDKKPKWKKLYLTLAIIVHIACFALFKYYEFVVSELENHFTNFRAIWDIVLPIGISFYTFQGISYIVDVYRGTVKPEKSILKFGVYIAMFEQLIAGPIVTYSEVKDDLHNRNIRLKVVLEGIGYFIFGLGLKVLLANPLGKLWSNTQAIGFESISTPLAWMAIIAFSFQIYFDFWGYSLMAIGLGKMLGFNLPKNFDFPYLSLSMTEFWRRWHMTLGRWFREYVYIPLGGNKGSKIKVIRNLFIVWMLTGIWHGAGYNYILWGFVLFCLITIEKIFIGKYLNKSPILGHLYMILCIPLSWMVFAINEISDLKIFFTRLFPFFGQGVWSVFRYDYLKYLKIYSPFLVVALLLCTRLPFKLLDKIREKKWLVWIILAVILIASVYCMYRGLDDPFLYFIF